MKLEGSCHCGKVRFRCEAQSPVPFLRCYCSICRKTAGGGGYAINLGADAATLEVEGEPHLGTYHARIEDDGQCRISGAARRFCTGCGSALWLFDPQWPELVHPHASAIDTPLPTPPEHVHMMLGSKAPWVEAQRAPGDRCFDRYPDESLEQWHRRHGCFDGPDAAGDGGTP
ncbi:GFA family protein [Lysobacter korlensis]|uniref:GFA family protein n=1 Tax=Lysobacter korlensis TaxID=553636 RepID=A0ABV6RTD5_9GAMM